MFKEAPVDNLAENEHFGKFYLDENSTIEITSTSHNIDFPRWMHIAHCLDKRMALIIIAGEQIKLSDTIKIDKDTRFYFRYSAALPSISADGLSCQISFFERDHSESLISLHLKGGDQSSEWRTVEFDISFLNGRTGSLVVQCLPGANNDPRADWLAISDLCVGREDQLSLLKARSFKLLRSRNEIEHFSKVYRDGMYSNIQDQHAAMAAGRSRLVRKLERGNGRVDKKWSSAIVNDLPLYGESSYSYALRLLTENIPQIPPNFIERLKLKAASTSVVRILSLCSGAARIEASLAAQVPENVEWSLLDINVDLLSLASKQFAAAVKLDLIEANVNELTFTGEKWDVILCVSGLHHIVELEKLIKFCHDSLNEKGEFWSIGECVGRNGNRLWPDARAEANDFFYHLPEKYRFNRHLNQIDSTIPDNDYSVGSFEGIRSEDIEPILDRWFQPIDVYRKNCFLWRLINQAYSDNYDLQNTEDRLWLVRMVNAELNHFRSGGRGTELFGVYRPRLLSISDEPAKHDGHNQHNLYAEPQGFLELKEIPPDHSKSHKTPVVESLEPEVFKGQQVIAGQCNVCGKLTRFFYQQAALWRESLNCEHCKTTSRYRSIAKGVLRAICELTTIDAPDLASLPHISGKKLHVYDTQPPFYYEPCAYPLPDLLKVTGWIDTELSQYKPMLPLGSSLSDQGVTNQNLECLTFANESMDIVITSDVMEHVRLDDRAHKEIYRILKPGGIYIFTVPHVRAWDETLIRVQVTNTDDSSKDIYLMEPEYHGDTNSDENLGVLAYRTYGRDLETFLSDLGFEVEYTREDIEYHGILNTELYYCRKIQC